jgi:hypothetical protein
MEDNIKMELKEIQREVAKRIFHGQLSDYQVFTPDSAPWSYYQNKE